MLVSHKITHKTLIKKEALGKKDKQMITAIINLYGEYIKQKLLRGDSYYLTSGLQSKKIIELRIVQKKRREVKYVTEPRLKVAIYVSGGTYNRRRLLIHTERALQNFLNKMPIRDRYKFTLE